MTDSVPPGSAPGKPRRDLSWLALIVIALGGFALQRALSPEAVSVEPPDTRPLVAVAPYRRSEDAIAVQRLGRIHALHETRLASEISGRVVSVHPDLRPGGRLARGTELLRLDDRHLIVRQAELEAERRARRAEREQLQLRFSRLSDLARQDFVAGDQLDELRARLTAAEAAVERVDAQLAAVALDIERSVLQAPFAAEVIEVAVAPGDVAQPGAILAHIVTVDEREVRIPLTQAELPMLEAAWRRQALGAGLDVGQGHAAVLSQPRLARSIDEASRTVLLTFRVAAASPVRRGEFVNVTLRIEPQTAYYRLPRSALQREPGLVWRVLDDELLMSARVEPLLFSGDDVFVHSDELGEEGEVMTTALPAVTEGMQVQVRQRREAAP